MRKFVHVLTALLLVGGAVGLVSCGGSATGPILPPPGGNALTIDYPIEGAILDRVRKYTTGGMVSKWQTASLTLDCGGGYIDGPHAVIIDGTAWSLDYMPPPDWPYLPDCAMWVLSGDDRVADKISGDKRSVVVAPPPLPLGPG